MAPNVEGRNKTGRRDGHRRPGRPRLEEPSPEYVARRAEIIETAARVFQVKGYDSGSLDDVAEALDLRKASLYYYVRSKAELLYLVFDRAIAWGLEHLDELTHIEDPKERLIALIRHQALVVAGEPSLFTVFFDQRPRLDPAYEEIIREKEKRYLRAFSQGVQLAVESGVLGDIDPRLGAQALMGMTSWAYKWFVPGVHDAEAFADTCVELIFGGRPAAGRR